MRGTVAGGLWGLVIGGFALAITSQLAAPPAREPALGDDPDSLRALETAAPATTETPVDAAPAPDAQAQTEVPSAAAPDQTDEVAVTEEQPAVAEQTSDTIAPVDTPAAEPEAEETVAEAPDSAVEQAPAELPAAAQAQIDPAPAEQAIATPQEEALPVEETPLETEVVPEPPAAVPDVADDPVQSEARIEAVEPQIATEPDEPVAPDVTASPPQVALAEDETIIAPQTPAPAPVMNAPNQQVTEVDPPQDDASPATTQPTPSDTDANIAEASPTLDVPSEGVERAPEANRDLAAQIVDDDTLPAPEVLARAPIIVDEQARDETAPAPDTSARVRVNRPGVTPTPAAPLDSTEETADGASDQAPPIERFATPFENADALPLLTVVLVDAGDIGVTAEKVAALDFPVTVVIDPLGADAASRMQSYRAKGIEVGLQAQLPEGATPSDVEVAFEAAFRTVPEAVLLFSDGQDGIQSDRNVTAQVMQVLASEGRGLIAVQQGLGNTLRAAGQANVPAAEVARDLDGQGQDQRAVNRALEQAAFRARQTGDAVLLARMSVDTLDALAAWAARNRSDQYKLAPASAILLER
ncbi:divergent polysaccharide deacetylase family protein [Yoonia sediminilitoris]|uniref:Polysaccharide deacetylase 2 family uncharacterized protein YibQ n=1 Tax=Yoonia sediminilitoris TaxID=1286148 RepID=A0A2T6KRW8_9RHOB|nr:divergent polysaccharide deacetylase family protein [Yoonia sediminilitoris]PUB19301.1 polysaccharide deacetylase 2 family uncharacterized protein YibQ [Yoonia sediminilitoris]RCW99469.1 polysaccharide deacetylase 2 family uncharacterized protein YibQ [Yoonia sediminilitoris]